MSATSSATPSSPAALIAAVDRAVEAAAVAQPGHRVVLGELRAGARRRAPPPARWRPGWRTRAASRSRSVGGSIRSTGSSAQTKPSSASVLAVQRHHQPVVVPAARAAAVALRGVALRQPRRTSSSACVAREQHAALALERRVQQRLEHARRPVAPGRRLAVRPAGRTTPAASCRRSSTSTSATRSNPSASGCRRTPPAATSSWRVAPGQVARHAQQVLDLGAVPRRRRRVLGGLDHEAGLGGDRGEHVDVGVGRAPPARRLVDGEHRRSSRRWPSAGHEQARPRAARRQDRSLAPPGGM